MSHVCCTCYSRYFTYGISDDRPHNGKHPGENVNKEHNFIRHQLLVLERPERGWNQRFASFAMLTNKKLIDYSISQLYVNVMNSPDAMMFHFSTKGRNN